MLLIGKGACMKKTLSVLIPLMLMIALILNQALPADAAKKNVKKKGVSQEVLTDLTTKVNALTKKPTKENSIPQKIQKR